MLTTKHTNPEINLKKKYKKSILYLFFKKIKNFLNSPLAGWLSTLTDNVCLLLEYENLSISPQYEPQITIWTTKTVLFKCRVQLINTKKKIDRIYLHNEKHRYIFSSIINMIYMMIIIPVKRKRPVSLQILSTKQISTHTRFVFYWLKKKGVFCVHVYFIPVAK